MKKGKQCTLVTQAEERNLRNHKEKVDRILSSKRKEKSKSSAFTSVFTPNAKSSINIGSIFILITEIKNLLGKKKEIDIVKMKRNLNKIISAVNNKNANQPIEIISKIEKENIPEMLMLIQFTDSELMKITFDLFTACTCESKKFSQLLIKKGIFDIIRRELQKGYSNKTEILLSSMLKLVINLIADYKETISSNSDIFLILIREFLDKKSINSLLLFDVLQKAILDLKGKIEEQDVLLITNKIIDTIPRTVGEIENTDIVVKLLVKLCKSYWSIVFSVSQIHDAMLPLFNEIIDNISHNPSLYFLLMTIYLNKNFYQKILNLLLEREFNVTLAKYIDASPNEEVLCYISYILSSLVIDCKGFFNSELITVVISAAEKCENKEIYLNFHSVLCNLANEDDLMKKFKFLEAIMKGMEKFPDEYEVIGMGHDSIMRYIIKYSEEKTGFINDIPFKKVENQIKKILEKAENEKTKGMIDELVDSMASL